MSTESKEQDTELVPSTQFNQEKSPSKLVKRGLEDVERDALTTEQIVVARHENTELKSLSDEAVQLAVKKPTCWEYRLFFQTLIDEVNGYESLRQARTLGFMLGTTEKIPQEETISWLLERFDETDQLLNHFNSLINHNLPDAFGAPGQSGDVSAIVIISRQLGLIYKQFLEISIRCTKAQHSTVFDGVFREMAKINENTLKEFEEFPTNALLSLMTFIASPTSDKNQRLNLTMSLTADARPFVAEINKIRSKMGL